MVAAYGLIAVLVHTLGGPLDQSPDAPWFRRGLVGMEVGPTGAQWGADKADTGYAERFNGADVVRAQIEVHSDYLVIWGKDSEYAYYDSQVAPKCPGLGERDILREAVNTAKPHDLPVIVYCVVQGNGYPLRDHPEYKMIDADGQPIDRICFNSGYLNHAKAVAAEILQYNIDGFHIDMIDQGFGPPYGCWCARCKAGFEREYGMPPPNGITWDDAWDKMLEFRYKTSERFERELREFIRERNPKVSVDFNYHGYPPFSWEVGQRPVQHAHIGDFVTCESGVWGFSALGAGLTAQFTRATDPEAVYQVVMQRGMRMYHDQTTRPLNDLRWEMFALLANGAQVTVVDKTPFDGNIDRVAYERIGAVFREVQAKRAHFGYPLVQEVGIYYSSRTRDWYGRETPSKYIQSFFGAHKALVYEHIPYGVLLDENVTIKKLKAFPVVLLADAAILSPAEAALFEEYVKQGGRLIITGITGMYGRMGELLDANVLEPLIGARAIEVLKDNDNFFEFPSDKDWSASCEPDIPPDWPVLAYGPAVVYGPLEDVKPERPPGAVPYYIPGSEMLADKEPANFRGVLRRPIRTLRQQQGLEGTMFPSSAGEPVGPAVISHRVGMGSVITLAVSPGAAIASEYRTVEARMLLRNAIRACSPEARVRIQAPVFVETVVSDDTAARILRVHCVAYVSPPGATSPNRPMILPDPVEDVPKYRIGVTCFGHYKNAEAVNSMTKLGGANGTVYADIEDIHEILLIHY
ncbi:MAG TPA: hypothetical protein PKI11_13145 [Candidatus Hydrogenedentes bacterium]|nr:hypothetical protein [Candidatus Hydrogenedentota bacterium]